MRAGDELSLKEPLGERKKIPRGLIPYLSTHIILRARSAPEFENLTLESRRHLFVSAYTATTETDRMGTRLRGNKIELTAPLSMTSSPLLPGTLQLPPNGQPVFADASLAKMNVRSRAAMSFTVGLCRGFRSKGLFNAR